MSVPRELRVFDPESIRTALDRNLPEGLRALADAIEGNEVHGAVINVVGCGFTNWRDTNAHVRVVLDVAAPVYRWVGGQKVLLDEPPRLELPA